jgi:uncharacterized protein involved in exopolysaccharide biosynthesis
MHRSGTSALTGLLCRFGASAGTDLLPANESNPSVSLSTGESSQTSGAVEGIDLIDWAIVFWGKRITILSYALVGLLIGVLIGLMTPKQYTVSASLMPEFSTESIGSGASSLLRQFGGLAGLSLGSYNPTSNAIRVDLYPEIVHTRPFQVNLMNTSFFIPEIDSVVTLYSYYTSLKKPDPMEAFVDWTFGLPFKVLDSVKEGKVESSQIPVDSLLPDKAIYLSESQMDVAKVLDKHVTATLDPKSGIMLIEVTMPDPLLAVHVGQYVIDQLTLYLSEYITEKVQRDLDFTQSRLAEARERFNQAGVAISEFQERMPVTPTARNRKGEQFLQSEYEIAFGIYNTLSQQLEQQKLKVQEETPVFKTLQPVQLPNKPSAPRVFRILFISTAFFTFISMLVIVIQRSRNT